MAALKIKAGEWVIVCDGAKSLILENIGDEVFPNLKTRDVETQADPRTSELGTDAPGRMHQSVGTARSAVEQTDWHRQAEEAFLQDLAGRMHAALTAGEVTSFILVAPPRALGVLRGAISPQVREAIHCEVAKDLVKMPVHEIESHLTQWEAA